MIARVCAPPAAEYALPPCRSQGALVAFVAVSTPMVITLLVGGRGVRETVRPPSMLYMFFQPSCANPVLTVLYLYQPMCRSAETCPRALRGVRDAVIAAAASLHSVLSGGVALLDDRAAVIIVVFALSKAASLALSDRPDIVLDSALARSGSLIFIHH